VYPSPGRFFLPKAACPVNGAGRSAPGLSHTASESVARTCDGFLCLILPEQAVIITVTPNFQPLNMRLSALHCIFIARNSHQPKSIPHRLKNLGLANCRSRCMVLVHGDRCRCSVADPCISIRQHLMVDQRSLPSVGLVSDAELIRNQFRIMQRFRRKPLGLPISGKLLHMIFYQTRFVSRS